MPLKTILKDLKVVEFANVLAGPAVGMFFAELGAKVIKVENKTTGGDLTRHWKHTTEDPASPVSAYYASVNFGKEVILLDLNDMQDREKADQLIRDADIVISNFRKADALKFRMEYSDLKKLNKQIIHGNISAYGEDDPRAGFDLVLQAEAGFMSMNGTAESGPLKMPVALIDVLAAHHLKEGLLLALIRKMKTGEGAHVTVSLYEAAIASLVNQASNYLNAGFVAGLIGSLHPNIAPYGEILLSREGKQIVLAVGNDKQFLALCHVLELTDLASHPEYISNPVRLKNRIQLGTALIKASQKFESEVLLSKLNQAGIPSGLILSLDAVLTNPEVKPMILEELKEGLHMKCVSGLAFRLRG
jgi:crotonobetainyl-CoA:carnitine CoA-transferase CaiB-like acyl-CoA transferase